MSELHTEQPCLNTIALKKERAVDIRDRGRGLFDAGVPGIQIAATLCELTEQFLVELIEDDQSRLTADVREATRQQGAVIAVGGTGRGELSPFSDVDLLFLDAGGSDSTFRDFSSRMVQSCWDAKIGLGHSVRTLDQCLAMARQDSSAATSLIEARTLWGDPALCERLRRLFRRRIIDAHRRKFVENCLEARADEFPEPGVPAQELQPNVKCSLGGLRDLHLIRWIGFALFGSCELDSLRLKGALSMDEAHAVRGAWEFLTRVRFDLHLEADKAQDILTRDEQLRITEEREIRGTVGQRSVEVFMQNYFRHSTALAKVSRRFAARHRPRSLFSRINSSLLSHRTEGVLRVSPDRLDAAPRHLTRLCKDLESILKLYRAAALYGVLPSPRLVDAIEAGVRPLSDDVSRNAARYFMDILRCTTHLGPVLRSMYETGVLERVIPDIRHARCLMQFNQYHHYTVDEHSFRAVEAGTRLPEMGGQVGAAYTAIRHKEILHLALLLHDLGKGFDEHHWEVGARIAERIGERLRLDRHHREQLVQLVHQHLEMSHTALRRAISAPTLILQCSHQVGSTETLTTLYAHTVADIVAVGPEAWTSWKGEFLAELYQRSRRILSGTEDGEELSSRLREIRKDVRTALAGISTEYGAPPWDYWADRQLECASAYYLTVTPPERIAADLDTIRRLPEGEVAAYAQQNPDNNTIEFRILTRNSATVAGCFHKLAGALTAKRLEILSADISTTHEGGIIDSFLVVDHDYDGAVSPERLIDVSTALEKVLREGTPVEDLFQRHRRFGAGEQRNSISNLPLRVEVDNDMSDNRTVIDVFAHDRPGLLYSVSRAIYELGLSVDFARISTHYDQVLDVFYVREPDGSKVAGEQRLNQIRDELTATLQEFENGGYRRFVA